MIYPDNINNNSNNNCNNSNCNNKNQNQKNIIMVEGYEEFLKDETSFLLILFYLLSFNLAILFRFFYTYNGIESFIEVILTIPGYLYIYSIAQHHHFKQLKSLPIKTITLGNIVVILLGIITGLLLFIPAKDNVCYGVLCISSNIKNGFQPNLFAFSISNTVFSPMAIRCHTPIASGISVIVKLVLILFAAYYVQAEFGTYLTIFSIMFFQAFFLYHYESYTKRIYINKIERESHLRATMAIENEKILMELQTKEIRALIGNVAHDLKSPLQAFTFELDTLMTKFQDNNGISDRSGVESVLLLKSISNFMVMLINRAIDFTKANSGIGLKPNNETIQIKETLEWVIRCALRCNRNLPIEIVDNVNSISQYIITDRQWLLENLLCLVSNAQKFTSKGAITIRFNLVNSPLPPPPNTTQITPTSQLSQQGPRISLQQIQPFEIGQKPLLTISSNQILKGTSKKKSSDKIPFQTADSLSSNETSSFLQFEVEDSGIGISDADKKELFLPFKQAQRRAGGTGLGLYSLSKRIECLGGKCGVRDRLDGQRGTCFWFTIPYKPDKSIILQPSDLEKNDYVRPIEGTLENIEDRVTRSSFRELEIADLDHSASSDSIEVTKSKSNKLFTITGGNFQFNSSFLDNTELNIYSDVSIPQPKNSDNNYFNRILLVEDSTLIQKTTTRALLREGYHVDVAKNGLECIEILENNTYHIILMDIQMPLMDGYEATRRLREIEKTKQLFHVSDLVYQSIDQNDDNNDDIESGFTNITNNNQNKQNNYNRRLLVIGLSANSDSETREAAYAVGMDEFIEKPLNIESLKECLKRFNCYS